MENLELGETLSAIFGEPTELAPGITAYGGEAPEPTPAAPVLDRHKLDRLTPDELEIIADQIAGFILLTHAYCHIGPADGAGEIILNLRTGIQCTMHHYAFMVSMGLDRPGRWEMRR